MKIAVKIMTMLLTIAFFAGCKKDDNNDIPSSDYELSADGKTLVKWLNPETTTINMQADSKLREVTAIGYEAFKSHSKISSIVISDKVTIIGTKAFWDCTLKNVTIPNSVTTLQEKCFYGSNLSSVTIPGSVKNIGVRAFYYSSITTLKIEEGVATIGEEAFRNCKLLDNVSLPNSLTSIGGSAFLVCTSLPTITIPKNVTYIGVGTFFSCPNLVTANVEATNPPTLDEKIFSHVKRINVPANSVNAYKTANIWKEYADLIMPLP